MSNEMASKRYIPAKLAQTYLLHAKRMVVTSSRQSSAAITDPPWYFELQVWALVEGELGKLLDVRGVGGCEQIALWLHLSTCDRLVREAGEPPCDT